jgi:hypothetical protein
MVYEYDRYHSRLPLPPPFNLITIAINAYILIRNKIRFSKKSQIVSNALSDFGDKAIIEKELRYSVIVLKNEKLNETQKEQTSER